MRFRNLRGLCANFLKILSLIYVVLPLLHISASAQTTHFPRKKCLDVGFKAGTAEHEDCVRQYVKSSGGAVGSKPVSKQNSALPVAKGVPLALTPAQREDKFWDDAQAAGNKAAYEAYLESYPAGRYVSLAKANIARLEAVVDQKAVSDREEKFWDDAKALGNAEAFEAYLERYPSGQFFLLARSHLLRIHIELAELIKAQPKPYVFIIPELTSSGMPRLYSQAIKGLRAQASAAQLSDLMAIYQRQAETGDPQAQISFGTMFREGLGVDKNEMRAINLYRKAADQGSASGQFIMGNMYELGIGVRKDEADAVSWYRKSAENGYALAQANLALAYALGRGIAKDDAEAVRWYRKSADQNYPNAQSGLGGMYAQGRGVMKDEAEAIKWHRKAAEQNFPISQATLGLMYAEGRGVAKDDVEAVKWFRKAAEQSNAFSQNYIGVMFRTGRGVVKSDAEAVRWYQIAADQNEPYAQSNLGAMYERGLGGLSRDLNMAIALYRKAAAQGNEPAKQSLSRLGAK